MKITADQLLKIAGIVPTTTLRTRLNESATVTNEATSSSELKRLQAEAKSIGDKIDDIVEDGGTVSLTDPLNIKLRKVHAQIKKLKSTKQGMKEGMNEAASSSDVKAASKILKDTWTGKDNNFHSSSSNGTIKVDYVMDKDAATKHANKHVATLKKHGISATPYVTRGERQGTPYFYHGVKLTSSVEEGMEGKSDSLEFQFGPLGKAVEAQIITMVDVMMDDEGFDPNTADIEDILNQVVEVISDMANEVIAQPAARRAVTKALGQSAQQFDDDGRAIRQRQLDV
jgi:hypothetical protein